MKQNNRRTKLKAIVAFVLVMASLFAIASLVSAGVVEEVFKEVCDGVYDHNFSISNARYHFIYPKIFIR